MRYRLLDSIRAFAAAALDEAGTGDLARRAHAEWYGPAARDATAGTRSARQSEFLSFTRAERANIDSALGWSTRAEPALALSIATGFGWSWIVLGDGRGADRLHAALAAAPPGSSVRPRADALLLAGWIEVTEWAAAAIHDARTLSGWSTR
jgi:predicted ATPase